MKLMNRMADNIAYRKTRYLMRAYDAYGVPLDDAMYKGTIAQAGFNLRIALYDLGIAFFRVG